MATSTLQPKATRKGGPLARLNAKSTVVPLSGCWEWTGRRDPDGYGVFWNGTTNTAAHRAAYLMFVGPVPEGMELDHRCHTDDRACPGGPTCRHRACVNPDHLEPVTHRENSLRGRQAGPRVEDTAERIAAFLAGAPEFPSVGAFLHHAAKAGC